MDDRKQHDDSLPHEMPDASLANVPPTPVASAKGLTCGGLALGTSALAVAGALVLMSSQTTACRGSTRSAKLKFAERQAAIEQALQERQASEIGDNRTGDEHSDPPATNTNIHPR